MRAIKQPGPVDAIRVHWVEAKGREFSFFVEAGENLLEAVRRGFAAAGFASGVASLTGGRLGPFSYVMPALSTDGANAAFYSAVFRPPGVTKLKNAAMTFGTRDGGPFFHCHALWTEADGKVTGGHIMPDETMVAERFEVTALGIDGAAFTGVVDQETNFKLFSPLPSTVAGVPAPKRVLAMRLGPNQDFAHTLEAFCREQGIGRARIHGGVGSTIGARFEDGTAIDNFATEIAIRWGRILPDAKGELKAELDVVLVDYTGGLAEGRLVRGDNPVLMTMELVVEAL
ncbi:DUF296 domain-containing protein [Phreatobacter aquaticus]|uniref:DUF296 domain-containing protein n=1 Tax=Phreatobacter aquaticus TaxID=2570229 RepID=A0A4D7QMA1_9HYPH|nr:DUF296 domain-containing protein [Phreatobacter aquaticus]QCK85352.1 DUF296 domain-containing protein [Phreatobacter aquaticus]